MPQLQFPAAPRTAAGRPVSDRDHLECARRLLPDPTVTARDRVAAVLIVVFAQRIGRVARLSIDDITIDEDTVAIRLGESAITLPDPLASELRELVAERRGWVAAALSEHGGYSPGGAAGRPINEQSLSHQLKPIGVDCDQARRSALMHLAGRIPAALLADLLGINIRTAAMGRDRRRPWGDYPAIRSS